MRRPASGASRICGSAVTCAIAAARSRRGSRTSSGPRPSCAPHAGADRSRRSTVGSPAAMTRQTNAKRRHGTGHVYEKYGSFYGRWRAADGRLLNRRIGRVRLQGSTEGLTRAQAERHFRKLQEEEDVNPRPEPGAPAPTVDELATSLRERLELRGVRKSYLENCEYIQRVHLGPLIGDRRAAEVQRGDVEAFGRALLKRKLSPKSVRNIMGFLHAVFEHGIDRGHLRENPARRAEKPGRHRAGPSPDLQFLTMAELDAVLRAIPDEVVQPEPAPTRR